MRGVLLAVMLMLVQSVGHASVVTYRLQGSLFNGSFGTTFGILPGESGSLVGEFSINVTPSQLVPAGTVLDSSGSYFGSDIYAIDAANVLAFTATLGTKTWDLSDLFRLSDVVGPFGPSGTLVWIDADLDSPTQLWLGALDGDGELFFSFNGCGPQCSFSVFVYGTESNFGSQVSGPVSVAPVPLPAAAWLLLSGLAGLGILGRKAPVSRFRLLADLPKAVTPAPFHPFP